MAKRRAKKISKTEMKLRRKKYANNAKIKAIRQQAEKLSKLKPTSKIKTPDGKTTTASAAKNKLFKDIWKINEATEEINKGIERRFKKKVKRNAKRSDKRTKIKKGFEVFEFHSWGFKDAQKLVFGSPLINTFEGIDKKKDAEKIVAAIDESFLLMEGSNGTYEIILDYETGDATYKIIE